MFRKLPYCALSALLIVATASVAFSDEMKFRRAKRQGDLTLNNCPLVNGAKRVIISNGRFVWVRGARALARTDKVKLGTRYTSFACAPSSTDPTVTALFALKDSTSPPIEFVFAPENFPALKSKLPFACREIRSWPSLYVYKTIGSEHFSNSNCRRHTAGVYVRLGGDGIGTSCLQVRDSLGNVVAKLGAYNPPGDYEYRAYACYACGVSTPLSGEEIAERAKRKTGSKEIYIDTGSVCYGPLEADTCRNSTQC